MIHAVRCRLLTWKIYWRTRAKRKDCFHHDRLTGESWIKDQLIDMGMGKMFWCDKCERTWFV